MSKKTYQIPSLTSLGTVEEITLGRHRWQPRRHKKHWKDCGS